MPSDKRTALTIAGGAFVVGIGLIVADVAAGHSALGDAGWFIMCSTIGFIMGRL